jgi:hypothetical protein
MSQISSILTIYNLLISKNLISSILIVPTEKLEPIYTSNIFNINYIQSILNSKNLINLF